MSASLSYEIPRSIFDVILLCLDILFIVIEALGWVLLYYSSL